jgi:APA family basic amino acid/polyamine antiporter
MAERRLHGLQRVLGVNALFATAYGNVGSSIYYALGLVAGLALGLTPVVFLISGVIFILTASTYAEATAMYPEAGGSSSFARRAFNEFASFFAGWGSLLTYTVTIATSAFFVPHYLGGAFWSELRHAPGDILFGIGVIALLAFVNVRGAQESSRVNIALAVLDFMTQLLLVLLGIFLVLSPETLVENVDFGVAPSWGDFFLAIPLCMLAYTGIETISNMAEEARDERRTIPAAIKRVVIAVLTIYAVLPAVALSALPVHETANGEHVTLLGEPKADGGYAGDPILGVVRQMDLGVFQAGAEAYVCILAATILLVATNAGIIGVSRLVYSMGVHRQVPDRLRQLHPRYGTPWLGIVLFGGIACVMLLPGQAEFLGNIYAFGAMLSFTVAHVSLIRLRGKVPDAERPWRGPGNLTVRGYDLPLFAVVGGLATLTAMVVLAARNPVVTAVALSWLATGVVVYVAFRRSQGLDLTSIHKVVLPKPVVDHEAEYDSVLVAFDALRYDASAVGTAVRLAARRRRGIHVLVTIVVPQSSPIDAALPEQERAAVELIEQAKLQGGRRVSGHWVKVRAGQAGSTIVREAREMRAEAIVMALVPRAGSTLFSRTVETVLSERPCRVIIAASPGTASPSPDLIAAAG